MYMSIFLFFFMETETTEIYTYLHTLSLHDAIPISDAARSGVSRALHLGGRERKLQAGGPIAAAITVYASEPPVIEAGALARLEGSVTLVHSPNAARRLDHLAATIDRSEEHTSELQSLMRISYAVFCLKKKTQ